MPTTTGDRERDSDRTSCILPAHFCVFGRASLDLFIAVEGKHGLLWFDLDSGNLQPILIAPMRSRSLVCP